MSNLRRVLALRYALVVCAVYLLVILPLHAIPGVRHIWWILMAAFAFLLIVVIAVSIRAAEAAAERGKLEAVLRNISAGVMVTDPDGRIIMLNRAAEDILGVGQQKAEGCRIIEVFSSRELDQAVARAW